VNGRKRAQQDKRRQQASPLSPLAAANALHRSSQALWRRIMLPQRMRRTSAFAAERGHKLDGKHPQNRST